MENGFFHHRLILIKISWSILERGNLYDAVRASWKINLKRAHNANYIAAVENGIIKEIYLIHEWYPAKKEIFHWLKEDIPGRFGFTGTLAPEEVRSLYIEKQIPSEYRKKGAGNPVRYTY